MIAWVCLWLLPLLATAQGAWNPLLLRLAEEVPVLPSWLGTQGEVAPMGDQTLDGVRFRVGSALRLAGLSAARQGRAYPSQILGLGPSGACGSLALLHGLEGEARPGTPIFLVRLHFEDGTSTSFRISSGLQTGTPVDGRRLDLRDPASTQVWPPGLQAGSPALCVTRLRNPRPDAKVVSVDLISLLSSATPVIYALSVHPPSLTEGVPSAPTGGLAKKAAAPADSDLRRAFSVRAVRAEGGVPLPKARFFLTIAGDDRLYFLESADADAEGNATLHFPPSQTVDLSVFVRAPGYEGAVFRQSRRSGVGWKEAHTFALAEGRKGGGVVHTATGKPIAGATVTVFRVTPDAAKGGGSERADHEVVQTGPDGVWSTRCLPQDLSGFQMRIEHPHYASLEAQVTGGDDRPAAPGDLVRRLPRRSVGGAMLRWSAAELLKGNIQAVLQEVPELVASVRDGSGAPVGGARLVHFMSGRDPSFVGAPSTSEGLLSVRRPSEAMGFLFVTCEGYAPSLVGSSLPEKGGKLSLTLRKPEPLLIRVRDRKGVPVEGAQANILSWHGLPVNARALITDVAGICRWSNAVPGPLAIRLSRKGYNRTESTSLSEGGTFDMVMERQAQLFGVVKDVETHQPIRDFSAVRGYSYNVGEPLRWQRGNSIRGRDGEFTGVLYNYGSESKQAFMIEAPGYLPVVSPDYKAEGWVTNEFLMRRTQGISGIVQLPDGNPARNTAVVLVEGDEWVFVEKTGQITRSSNYADQTRTDLQGKFEFQPHLNPTRIVASQIAGVADVSVKEFEGTGTMQLQPWGRVEGQFKVSGGLRSNQTVRIETFRPPSYGGQGSRERAVWVSLKTVPDAQGNFLFDRVAPGARDIYIQSKFSDRRNGPDAVSHGVVVDVAPGSTNRVTLGGGGRKVVGRIRLEGGDASEVDWLWDVHEMQFVPPAPADFPTLNLSGTQSEDARRQLQVRYQERMRLFQESPEGQRYERARRRYALLFDTNGTFYVENVPPGDYQVRVVPTEKPSDPDSYSYRPIGQLSTLVKIPKAAQATDVFDLGALDMKMQGGARQGGVAPAFELEQADGTKLKSSDLRGKVILLYFWATWALNSNEVNILNEIHTMYGEDDRFVLISLCSQVDKKQLTEAVKQQGMPGRAVALPEGPGQAVVQSYSVDGWPTAIVIGHDGRIAAFQVRGSSIRSAVTRAMGRMKGPTAAPTLLKTAP